MKDLTSRELATVLAALRLFQREGIGSHHELADHFADVRPLTDPQIDALCERLNVADADGKPGNQ
jgi:hypothetical protein